MSHDDSMPINDPISGVELELTVDGKTLPLNAFSKSAIVRVVVALVSSYRGAERYRDSAPRKVEIKLS
jgi:hypothetical protein